MIKKQTKNIIYAFVSVVILSLPWLVEAPGILLFIGFVPLLLLEDKLSNEETKSRFIFANYSIAIFFLWNLLSAWWLGYATLTGLILFLFLNTFLMSIIWQLYHQFKQFTNENLALIFLVSLWLAFEFLHLNWDMQLPGMTLGGTFGNQTKLVQWYEYTGELGGSLWIFTINILIYKAVKHLKEQKRANTKALIIAFSGIIIPIAISLFIYLSYTSKGNPVNLRVVQPNINPYTEKFSGFSQEKQFDILKSLILPTKNECIIVGPETALAPFWEDSINTVPSILEIKRILNDQQKIIIGANTKKLLSENEKSTATTRFTEKGKQRYEEYNSSILIDHSGSVQIYHKNILVSGVEKVPFANKLEILKNFFFDIGGTTGGLRKGEPINFSINKNLQITPIICFESMFGEYIGKLIQKGGELIIVITNDGWWKKSSGAKLHFSYSRLRAIEMRRSIARSANTGISGFIDQKGNVISSTQWWTATSTEAKLTTNDQITFYAQFGDYIGRIASFMAGMLLLFFISVKLKGKTETTSR